MKAAEAYQEYLKSAHWKQLRGQVLKRDGRKCTRCPSQSRLQVHHKFYRERWEDSEPDDLITLCRKCHKAEHGLIPAAMIPRPLNMVTNTVGKGGNNPSQYRSRSSMKKRRRDFFKKKQRLGWSF
jgi:hypothetical protein